MKAGLSKDLCPADIYIQDIQPVILLSGLCREKNIFFYFKRITFVLVITSSICIR